MLVVVLLLPVFLLQVGVFGVWYHTRLRESRETNLELARAVATAFDAYVQDLYRQQHTLGAALGAMKEHPFSESSRLLAASEEQYEPVRALHWADDRGLIVASSDPNSLHFNVAGYDFFQAIESGQERVVSNLITSWVTGRPVFIVGQRVRDPSGRAMGMLLAAVYPDVLGSRMPDFEPGSSDIFSLFDATGRVVFASAPGWVGLAPTGEQDPALQDALAGREAAGRLIAPGSGERRLAARVPVPSTRWAAGASVSLASVTSPLTRGLIVVALVLAAVAVSCVAVALLISRRIIHPLNALRRQTHLIGAGRLDQPARVRGLAELEELADAFNRMSEQLAAARAELEHTNADLMRSNRDLEQFAYIASHDLQEPLRAVAGFTTLLQQRYEGQLDEKADSYIHSVVDGVARMQALISGLLEYSRVGTRGNAPVPVRADEALNEALANLQVPIQQSNAVVAAMPLPTVLADGAQLTHVFQNLIGNALKFRSERRPEIEVGSRPQDGSWLFWVRDNGIGIEPQYAERIFLIFQRLHTRNNYPGTGIGLAICKRIVERHGGKIWVESQPNQGSTFYFSLPDQGA